MNTTKQPEKDLIQIPNSKNYLKKQSFNYKLTI